MDRAWVTTRPLHMAMLAVAAALLLGACSGDEPAAEWGAPAESFFADWERAWASADPYDIVRFYDADLTVGLAQDYRTLTLSAGYRGTAVSGEGRSWLAAWVDKQYEPRQRSLNQLYLGDSVAVAMVTVDELETAAAVNLGMGDSSIVAHTDLRWRDAHLPGGVPDDRLAWLDELAAVYIAGWTTGHPDLESRYADEASVWGFPAQSLTLETALSTLTYRDAAIATLSTGERRGPAVFVGPNSAAIGLEATLADGCAAQLMVHLTLDGQTISSEERLPTADTVRRCFGDEAPGDGWWNSLTIPVPVDQQVTGSVVTGDGESITIVNGTPELESLLEWGLDRFALSGLATPRLASVTFGPIPACASAPGRVTETQDDSLDLVLCTDVYAACLPDRASCTEFRSSDQLALLHELGHAWLIDNVDDQIQAEFLAVHGLSFWRDAAAPWHQRGVERAAETIAWGMLEERIELVRISNPPCTDIATGYELLTGTVSPHQCG